MAGRIAKVGTGGTGTGPGLRRRCGTDAGVLEFGPERGPGGAELAVRGSRYRSAKRGSGEC